MQLSKANIELISLIKGLKELGFLYVYINNIEALDFYFENPSLAVLKVYIDSTLTINNIGGLRKLRDLIIIGLDNKNRPLLKQFALLSMPNLKKLQLLNMDVENFPWDTDFLKDIECEIDYPVE